MAETSRNGIGWKEIAEAMGAHLLRTNAIEAEIYLRRGGRGHHLILTDNGGELNVSEIALVTPSVPYRRGAARVGPITLANRVLTALDGEPIDYALDFACSEDAS
jgi:hypothetical protein